MKLLTTFKSLLHESANINDVQDSIRKKIVVTIYYDGDELGGKGYRTIEPVCLGTSKAGNKVLRAWDLEERLIQTLQERNLYPDGECLD